MITEECPCWPEQHRGLRPTSHSVVASNSQVVRPSMLRIIHSHGFRIISRFGRTKLRPVWCRFEARREVLHSVYCSLVLCTWKCIIIGFHTVPRVEGRNSCGVNSQIQCVWDRRSSYACYGLFKWMRIWTIWEYFDGWVSDWGSLMFVSHNGYGGEHPCMHVYVHYRTAWTICIQLLAEQLCIGEENNVKKHYSETTSINDAGENDNSCPNTIVFFSHKQKHRHYVSTAAAAEEEEKEEGNSPRDCSRRQNDLQQQQKKQSIPVNLQCGRNKLRQCESRDRVERGAC